MTFEDLLLKKKYTIYKLSKKSGVAKTTLFDIASGKSDILNCSGGILLKISKCLQVTIEDLLSLDRALYMPYYEKNLPPFLDNSIRQLKKGLRTNSSVLDCYFDELMSSINVCEVENLITKPQADYLRRKYL